MRHLCLLLFMAWPAAWPQPPEAERLFTEGRYEEAAGLTIASDTANGHAFAARAILAAVITRDDEPSLVAVDLALTQAEMALELQPRHVEARLQLAIALALKARPLSNFRARRSGYGDRSKALAEAVLVDDPTNPYAHAFLAVWNIEVRRRGGALGAYIYGASVQNAREHYAEAQRVIPDDVSLHWQIGRALAALDAETYRAEADAALDLALAARADDALENTMQARASILKAALAEQDAEDVEAIAERLL